jgi:hypothetical protein
MQSTDFPWHITRPVVSYEIVPKRKEGRQPFYGQKSQRRSGIMKRILFMLSVLMCGTVLSATAEDELLRVAILPFESETKEETDQLKNFLHQALQVTKTAGPTTNKSYPSLTLSDKISETLTAHLSGNPALQLVERAKIDGVFDELALGKTGIVDESSAARIGHLLGAQVMVTGKAFPVDNELFIVAKVIGVETGRVFAAKANGPLTGKLIPITESLANGVSKIILKNGQDLVGKETPPQDHKRLIIEALGSLKRPIISVEVKESHMNHPSQDPAAETEIIFLLQQAGFTVIDQKNKPLSDWAMAYLKDSSLPPPKSVETQVIILGEAFSEFAARRGDLVSCKARVELRVIDIKTGNILAIGRKTGTAVDIAEQIAAKTALQKTAADIAVTLVPESVEKWNGK